MSYNKIIIIGNLGRDPELRYTPQGTPVCNFSVATTEKYRGQGGEQQEKTTWFKITVWGKQAEACSKFLAKGRPVYIEGRQRLEEWTDKDGKSRYTLEVNASEIQFLGGGDSNGDGHHHDQRRRGQDENERSQERSPRRARSNDALSLDDDGSGDEDSIPF